MGMQLLDENSEIILLKVKVILLKEKAKEQITGAVTYSDAIRAMLENSESDFKKKIDSVKDKDLDDVRKK